MANNKASSVNRSTVKAMRLIEYISVQPHAVRLSELANALNINKSTASRFLAALQQENYVTQDNNQRYRLTYKICSISNRFLSNSQHRDIIHPYLVELTNKIGESCCVSIPQNLSMVYIDVVAGPDRALMTMQKVGSTAPMHCTANGKLVLSRMSENDIDHYIEKKGLTKFTKNTIDTKEKLLKALEEIRDQGFAYDNEESEDGNVCIASPIFDYTGKIFGSIAFTGPKVRINRAFIRKHLSSLKETAARISADLGYNNK